MYISFQKQKMMRDSLNDILTWLIHGLFKILPVLLLLIEI